MLANTVHVSVTKATDYEPPVINLEFEEYGEFIGKRKMLWVKLPPIDKMVEFIKKKGIDVNNKVPGYKNGAPNLPEFKKIERIAWAIAKKKRKYNTFRRIPWKKESFPETLRKMNNETIEKFRDHIEQVIASSIEKGI